MHAYFVRTNTPDHPIAPPEDEYIIPIKVMASTRAEAAQKRCDLLSKARYHDRVACAVVTESDGNSPSTLHIPVAHRDEGCVDLYPVSLHVVDRVRGTVTPERQGR